MQKTIPPIKLILADDHEIFRDGFRAMIKKQPSVQLIGEAGDGEELIKICRDLKPDVVITDIKMPRMDGVEATKKLTEEMPEVGIIALSMFDEENLIVEMLEAGAKGYLLKNAHKDEIMDAIKAVDRNHTYYCNDTTARLANMIARRRFKPVSHVPKPEFSEKEYAVIRFICQEMSNKEIAFRLNLSIRTIEGYRDRILEKIGARNAAGIVVFAIRNNIYKIE